MSIEAMKQALDALEDTHYRIISAGLLDQYLLNRNFTVATALRERLAQPEQEPVAWAMDYDIESVLSGFSTSLMGTAMRIESAFPKHRVKLLYTTPPQRTWVGLTDEELNQICNSLDYYGDRGLVELIEAKLKEKNT